jgi:uncharacterized lipoprotein YddW (UPF0748 family)
MTAPKLPRTPTRAAFSARIAGLACLLAVGCSGDTTFTFPSQGPTESDATSDASAPAPADAEGGVWPGPDPPPRPTDDAGPTDAPDIAPDPPGDATDDPARPDILPPDVAPPPPDDASPLDDAVFPPPVETVAVGHEREFRGVWIATVANINFPSRRGLSAQQLRDELDALIDITARSGLNAIVFQARPEGDAMYASSIEPWSHFLTGTQGADPGLDPLAYLIERAHERAIEVHAWLNPYRAKSNRSSVAVSPHLSVTAATYAYPYGNTLWMDPGAQTVQQRLLDVIADLVSRYDLDGIHFDDYFYPYPDGPFPDDVTWQAYRAAGGTLTRDDWRRDNVNRMVEAVHGLILDLNPSVRFGISPFGIYRPGIPPGIRGLDQYASIFADPVRWMEEGWLDYVAPQLYWPTTQTAQAYETLLAWWVTVNPRVHVFAGTYLSRLGDTDAWSVAEFREQVRLSRAYRSGGSTGNIHFQIGPLVTNRSGIRDVFAQELYLRPALTPALGSAEFATVPAPRVESVGGEWRVESGDDRPIRAWTVYRAQGDAWVLAEIVPASRARIVPPAAGRWAIAAVDRQGVESPGVVVLHPAD